MRRARFGEVFEGGARVGGALVSARTLVGKGEVGVAVPKKARTKPRRNRIKRRVLAAVRACGEAPAGLDLVLVASLACREAPFESLAGTVAERIRAARASVESP